MSGSQTEDSCRAVPSVVALVLTGLVFVVLNVATASGQTVPPRGMEAAGRVAVPMVGPMLGYVWDSEAGGLRAVTGIPGAAVMQQPLYTGQNISAAVLSSHQDYALLSNNQGRLLIAHLPGGAPAEVALGLSPQQHVVLSPSGRAALVYDASAAKLLLLAGLPNRPVVSSISLKAPILAGAISDAATPVVASGKGDGSVEIAGVRKDGSSQPLTSIGRMGGLAFLPGRDDLLVADQANSTLSIVDNVSTAPSTYQLAGPGDGLASPSAVASSMDGNIVWMVNASDGSLISINLARPGTHTVVACDCKSAELERLQGNAVFRLSNFSGGPLRILDGEGNSPQLLFIPAPAKKNDAEVSAQ